jgi:phage shock protein PspC (stress-responsive transcriptional regulator)
MTKRLTRDTRRAALGGVAAGFARYLDVDPTFVRLAFVLLAFAHGFGLLAYIVCWIIMPRDDAPETTSVGVGGAEAVASEVRETAQRVASSLEQAGSGMGGVRALVGYSLMVVGALLLLDNLGWLHWPHWFSLSTLWPILLVGLGAGLVWRSLSTRSS